MNVAKIRYRIHDFSGRDLYCFLKVLESNHFKIPEVQLLCRTDSPPYSLSDLPQTSCACAPIALQMHKKFEVNQKKKIKGDISHTQNMYLGNLGVVPL